MTMQLIHDALVKFNLAQVLLYMFAFQYCDMFLGIIKAVTTKKTEKLQQIQVIINAFKSRTFLNGLLLKIAILTLLGVLYSFAHVVSVELAVMVAVPFFVYEISSIIENLSVLGVKIQISREEKKNE